MRTLTITDCLVLALGILGTALIAVWVIREELERERTADDALWVRNLDDYRRRAHNRAVAGRIRRGVSPADDLTDLTLPVE